MKHKPLFLLSALVVAFASVSLSAVPNPDYDPARYPGSTRMSGGDFDLTSLHKGIISQSGVYRTRDDSLTVWRWYTDHFGLTSFEMENAMGNCFSLGKDDHQALTRHTIGITLCSNTRGTMIFVTRTVFMFR